MSRVPIDHILELPTTERVAIVQEIWESMLEHPEDVAITAAQREELDRRWIDLEQNPDDGESWEDVKKSLLNE
ncbi:MAG TPA: addiction module protein [Thermoanaerobaculia bacterium]|jgi:putative addiction module component (TIGR02574 family)|nr:addiction module protein [Thermoanaerobaculia bacterium]